MDISAAMLPARVLSRTNLPRGQRLAVIGTRARAETLPPLARLTRFLSSNGIAEFGPPLAHGGGRASSLSTRSDSARFWPCTTASTGVQVRIVQQRPLLDETANGTYRPSDEDRAAYEAGVPDMASSSRADELMSLASGRSTEWLCAAATILDMNIDCRKDMEWMKSSIKEMTGPSRSAVDDAFDEVKGRGTIRLD